MSTIRELESRIYELCCQRAALLSEEDINEKYLIFENGELRFNENLVVLSPVENKSEIEAAIRVMDIPEVQKQDYRNWVEEFHNNSCTKVCPIVHTPRCCEVCSDVLDCEYSLVRCGSYGDTGECGKRGKYDN